MEMINGSRNVVEPETIMRSITTGCLEDLCLLQFMDRLPVQKSFPSFHSASSKEERKR